MQDFSISVKNLARRAIEYILVQSFSDAINGLGLIDQVFETEAPLSSYALPQSCGEYGTCGTLRKGAACDAVTRVFGSWPYSTEI